MKDTWTKEESVLFEKMLFLDEEKHTGTKEHHESTAFEEERKEEADKI